MAGKRTFAWMLALSALAAGPIMLGQGVRAEAAPVYREDMEISDIVVTENNCPIEVEREVLNFRVSEFPDSEKEGDYNACVTAEYTLYNPTDADRTASILVPCGRADSSSETSAAEPYTIMAGNSVVATERRYTYRSSTFRPAEDARRLSDEKRAEGLLSEDAPVTVRTYNFDRSTADSDYLHLVLHCNPAKTQVMFGAPVKTGIDNLGCIHAVWRPNELVGSLKVYSVGMPVDEFDFFAAADAVGSRAVRESGWGNAKSERVTLGELVEAERPKDSKIGEVDWFNGYIDMLQESVTDYGVSKLSFGSLNERCFVRWCEYSVTVPAQGRAVTSVVSPLYPTVVNGSFYRYDYRLSHTSHWAAVRSIEINIETPYKLSDSSWDFVEEEDGYSFSQQYLPLGELSFTLTEGGAPSQTPFIPYVGGRLNTLEIALIVLGSVAGILAAGFCAFLIMRRRRRAGNSGSRGETTEGVLPPDDNEK